LGEGREWKQSDVPIVFALFVAMIVIGLAMGLLIPLT
jgi:hypothetical protein